MALAIQTEAASPANSKSGVKLARCQRALTILDRMVLQTIDHRTRVCRHTKEHGNLPTKLPPFGATCT